MKKILLITFYFLLFTSACFSQGKGWWWCNDEATFLPTDVTSAIILGWYDMSDAAMTFTTWHPNGDLDSVKDKSGVQDAGISNTGALRPLLVTGQNSLSVADFAPLQYDNLYDDGFSGFEEVTDEFSIFAVVKFDALTGVGGSIVECSDNTTYSRGIMLYAYDDDLFFRPDGANEATAAFTNTSDYVIISAVNTPSSRTYYINGELQNTNSTSQNMTAVPTRIIVGALADNATFAIDGKIGEVIIYKGAISDTERMKVENYLNKGKKPKAWEIY